MEDLYKCKFSLLLRTYSLEVYEVPCFNPTVIPAASSAAGAILPMGAGIQVPDLARVGRSRWGCKPGVFLLGGLHSPPLLRLPGRWEL